MNNYLSKQDFLTFRKRLLQYLQYSNKRALTFYLKNDNDVPTMMKSPKELLLGYVYLTTSFHKCSTNTDNFCEKVQLTPSIRNNLKTPVFKVNESRNIA